MDKKLEKLKFLADGFYKRFQYTGSIYDYGKYRGTKQLIKEREQEIADQNSMQM